jgi:hypothetical protein
MCSVSNELHFLKNAPRYFGFFACVHSEKHCIRVYEPSAFHEWHVLSKVSVWGPKSFPTGFMENCEKINKIGTNLNFKLDDDENQFEMENWSILSVNWSILDKPVFIYPY